MRRIRFCVAMSFVVTFWTSCRTTTSETSEAGLPIVPPVLVVTGGFSSCGSISESQNQSGAWRHWGNPGAMDMAKPLAEVRKEYSRQFQTTAPPFIVSCFNGKISNYIYYYSSDNPKLRYTKWDEIRALADEIDRVSGSRDAIFVGHSYGGWLAMQLAQIAKAKKAGLVTIDPISPYHCNQGSYARSLLSSAIGESHNGCTKFPEDISPSATKKLKTTIANWHHYFQTDYRPLRSNVINNQGVEAESNISSGGHGFRISYPSGGMLGGVHAKIDTSDIVWSKVRQLLGIHNNTLNGMVGFPESAPSRGAQPGPATAEDTALNIGPSIDTATLPQDDVTSPQEQRPPSAPTDPSGRL